MENQNENITEKVTKKKKGKKSIIIIIIIILIVALGIIGCINYNSYINDNNSSNTSNNNVDDNDVDDNDTNQNDNNNTDVEDNNIIDNSANIDFDFDELSNTLHTSVQNDNITTFISDCENDNTNQNGEPKTIQNNIEVSNDTIDTIINKLKSAQSIESDISYSWFGCPPRGVTYFVSANSTDLETVYKERVFSLNYAIAENKLLVGYNNKGYAFNFNTAEEINNFIENLK